MNPGPEQRRGLGADDRGVSVTVTQVLTVAITAILVSGLLVAGNAVLQDQRQQAVRDQLEVVGQRLAAELQRADRLAARGTDASARLQTAHPNRIAGQPYTVALTTSCGPAAAPCLRLSVPDPDVTVTVPVANRSSVDTVSLPGGDLVVVADGALTLEESS